jgi:4-amino-4-deoxy-L-arabinose transferase-like glycosyltransferase
LAENEPSPPPHRSLRWLDAAAFGLVALTLGWPIAKGGIWDPFELRSIELARRIAIGLYGASGLELEGMNNELPTQGEVDRGELPFTSMALGLRCFGLHAWAGRLPLVLFALAGLFATYVLVRRLADRSAAILCVLVLGTMPLYFLHARTMLGDGVTMAAVAITVTGCALALFDRASTRVRVAWLALGALGIAAGLLTRGLILAVAVPLLGVGLAWLVLRLTGTLGRDRFTDTSGLALLGVGLLTATLGSRLLAHAVSVPERYFVWLGFGVTRPPTPPTFDAVVGALGHALFPWSALVPIALARITAFPSGLGAEARARESALRLTALTVAVLGLGAHGGLAPVAGVLPFGPVALLAVLLAVTLRDLGRGASLSRAAGLTGAALLVLLIADFINLPEKILTPFAVPSVRFPDSLKTAGHPWLLVGGVLAAFSFFAALLDRDESGSAPFSRRDYLAWVDTIRELWNGNLLFGACVVEAALLGFVGFDLLGERFPALARFGAGESLRLGGRLAWLVLPLLAVLPLAVLALRDAVRYLERARSRGGLCAWLPDRGALAASGAIACGAALSVGFYPEVAVHLSPQESYAAFLRLSKPGEPLALLGTSSATAPYAAGRSVVALGGTEQAYEWLFTPGPRRWLLLRSESLAGLNSRYRGRKGAGNLPILDAHSSEILLASNELRPGEKNENPLERYLLASAPQPMRPLDANLGDQLDVLGWDITDLDGRLARAIRPGRRYQFSLYFRVTARISGSWETFIHIDGFQRRYNGDHPTLDGRYPFALWRVGDILADRHEVVLEPNFTPGKYRVYVGLFAGSRRLPVRRGAHHEDRLDAGEITVE